MARPTVLHRRFLIPNAGDVASPQMAEPDRIDFNTLGNARYGVIEGCEVTVSGSSATNVAGTAIVNGALVTMAGGQSASLGSAGTQDRYDLLTVDVNGLMKVVPGTPAADPVFPDPPTNATTLAAVFCPAGAGSFVDNVIDKRKFLSDSLLTKIASSSSLVANRNGAGDLFRIAGDGSTVWANDTIMQRIDVKMLKITENLNLDGALNVGTDINARSLVTTGPVTSSNLRSGSAAPTGSANLGDLYQRTNGKLYLYQTNGWQELATVASAIPVGSVITSLVAPAAIGPGWVPLDGQTVIQEGTTPTLFAIPALATYITGGNAGARTMTMPDCRQRVLMGNFTAAGGYGGMSTITVALANMPAHKHGAATSGSITVNFPAGKTSQAGRHGHKVTPGTGRHPHVLTDPGHAHNGFANPVNGMPGAAVALMWGGQNKIDAYFNDRSHTYSVEAMDWTTPAFTGIQVTDIGSEHDHTVEAEGDHQHAVYLDPVTVPLADITENSMGNGTPINYQPLYLSVYVYVRS